MPRQCIRVLNRHAGSETWIERLREAGYDVDARPIRAPGDLKALGRNVPAAVAIDLARAPARDLGLAGRQLKTTRQVPLVIVEGGVQQVEQLRSLLPDAVCTSGRRIRGSVRRATRPGAADLGPGWLRGDALAQEAGDQAGVDSTFGKRPA